MTSIINPHKFFSNTHSVLLDGVDESVNINSILTNELATTTKGTFSMWIRPVDATPVAVELPLNFGDTNVNEFLAVQINTTATISVICRDAGVLQWHVRTDAAALSDATYTHIGVVQDGVLPVIYINAVAVAQTTITGVDTTIWLNDLAGLDNGRVACFNANSGGDSNHFNGHIDEVSFWDDNFTAGEITELYNSGIPTNLLGHSKVANLSGWYRMGEGATFGGGNWTIPDASVNTNAATSINLEEADRVEVVPL